MTRSVVDSGSSMTLSPLLSVITLGTVVVTWSSSRGETFGLNMAGELISTEQCRGNLQQQGRLTGADREDVDRDKVGSLGRSVGQEVLGAGGDHEDVGNTEDGNTPANELEAARL